MSMKPFGSRAEVFHGTAEKTSGGLRAKDLMLDAKDGQIKSVAAHQAALDRMKKEGKKHLERAKLSPGSASQPRSASSCLALNACETRFSSRRIHRSNG